MTYVSFGVKLPDILMLVSNFWSYWFKIHKYDVYTSNILQDIRQNYWIVKCRSVIETYICFRSNFRSYWLIIHKYDVCTSNTLQDIRQNYWIDNEMQVNVTYIYFEVKFPVILTWCLYIKYSSRYKAKLLDHEMYVTMAYIYFEIKLQIILTHNQKVC